MEISFIQMQSRQKRSLQLPASRQMWMSRIQMRLLHLKLKRQELEVISGSLAVIMEPAGSQQDLQEVVHQK